MSRQEAAERLGVGLSLLYELVARFRRRPQTSSLVRAGPRGPQPLVGPAGGGSRRVGD